MFLFIGLNWTNLIDCWIRQVFERDLPAVCYAVHSNGTITVQEMVTNG